VALKKAGLTEDGEIDIAVPRDGNGTFRRRILHEGDRWVNGLDERIVSTGRTTPAGEWFDPDRDEWVVLVAGAAEVLFEGEAAPRRLAPGDWLRIPAHARHRVTRTDPDRPTIWLALHHAPDQSPARPPDRK
jgi:cupin 2 domain-containing protein